MMLPAGQPAPRILVVEDDLHTRRINVLALSSAGYRVQEAADGATAIRAARESRPDLIVLDIALPGITGLGVLETLRSEMGSSAPPVIVLSARAMRDDFEAARRAGCDAYLAKPIDPFDLVHEVGRLLAARRGTS
jgi:CheY-like chemotaxis protein